MHRGTHAHRARARPPGERVRRHPEAAQAAGEGERPVHRPRAHRGCPARRQEMEVHAGREARGRSAAGERAGHRAGDRGPGAQGPCSTRDERRREGDQRGGAHREGPRRGAGRRVGAHDDPAMAGQGPPAHPGKAQLRGAFRDGTTDPGLPVPHCPRGHCVPARRLRDRKDGAGAIPGKVLRGGRDRVRGMRRARERDDRRAHRVPPSRRSQDRRAAHGPHRAHRQHLQHARWPPGKPPFSSG